MKARELALGMSEASKLLFAETERETNAFVNTYKQWKIASIILVVVFILFIFALRVFLLGDIMSYVFIHNYQRSSLLP